MKRNLPLLILLSSIACKKNQEAIPVPFKPIDTINNIIISTISPQAWIPVANTAPITISFNQDETLHGDPFTYNNINIGSWYGNYGEYCGGCEHYYLRYVGAVPLLNTDSVYYRYPTYLSYMPDKRLLNKPVFEVRTIVGDSLYKTYVFADSGTIVCPYYFSDTARAPRWGPPVGVSTDSITNVMSRYISPVELNYVGFTFEIDDF